MIKRHKETKRSVLLSRKENSFAGQPVVFWERKTGDQCFGEEKESHDRGGISENRIITITVFDYFMSLSLDEGACLPEITN